MTNFLSKVEGYRTQFESLLKEFTEIPTVSPDPAHREDHKKLAKRAVEVIQELGGEATLWETEGNPLVYGGFVRDENLPGIIIYNHLDVQPADEPEWQTEPFQMKIDGDRYIARGATDDKGPALTALIAAKYAYDQRIPLNIHFLWEFEEEIGSPHFEEALAEHRDEINVQSVMVLDSIWVSRNQPSVDYGLRGLQGATLRLQTANVDAHSGVTGGAAPNPIAELCRILMKCLDPVTGDVLIPGFYQDVIPPTDEELDSFEKSGFTLQSFQSNYGFRWLRQKTAREVLARIWAWPTFEIHGIAGGYQGPGIKTIIPHWAEAKVSMRLVPKQEPLKIFELFKNFVSELNPHVEVKMEGSLGPYLGEFRGPYADAMRNSCRRAFGKEPVFIREGGSIGAVVSMEKVLQVPIVMFGLSLPEHGYHAPNEYFDWGQAQNGFAIVNTYFEEISSIHAR